MKRMKSYCYVEIIGNYNINVHYYHHKSGDDYYLGILPNGDIRYFVADNEGNKTRLHKDVELFPIESKILNDMLDAYYNSVVA